MKYKVAVSNMDYFYVEVEASDRDEAETIVLDGLYTRYKPCGGEVYDVSVMEVEKDDK